MSLTILGYTKDFRIENINVVCVKIEVSDYLGLIGNDSDHSEIKRKNKTLKSIPN